MISMGAGKRTAGKSGVERVEIRCHVCIYIMLVCLIMHGCLFRWISAEKSQIISEKGQMLTKVNEDAHSVYSNHIGLDDGHDVQSPIQVSLKNRM